MGVGYTSPIKDNVGLGQPKPQSVSCNTMSVGIWCRGAGTASFGTAMKAEGLLINGPGLLESLYLGWALHASISRGGQTYILQQDDIGNPLQESLTEISFLRELSPEDFTKERMI